MKPPCLLYEDDHVLVANKPAGLNTHSPSPFAGEGLYDWLRHRDPRWAGLAIIHRLDKETSGVVLFSKSLLANRSLTEQFTRRSVHKKYLLLTDRAVRGTHLLVRSALVRVGEKYVSRPIAAGAQVAETRFSVPPPRGRWEGTLVVAEPLSGRTHQIRVQAAAQGFPVLGDLRYGGTPAPRLCLHAAELTIRHPLSGEELTFRAPADFDADPRLALRHALVDSTSNTAYRLVHGATDGWPGWYVDRLGAYLLSQSDEPLSEEQRAQLAMLGRAVAARGLYHKHLALSPGQKSRADAGPQLAEGLPAPERFPVLENGLQFELSFAEGYSTGLFLDQRDNRRRLLTGHIASGFPLSESPSPSNHSRPEVLNTFAYTCGFSVCAAKAGARTTSLDLSRKYLDWGKRNFQLNELDPADHDFIYGDVFDWLRRLAKKGRRFDLVLLDPPTFSRSPEHGLFRAEKDYVKLVKAALPLLRPRAVLLASCNASGFPTEAFLASIKEALDAAGRAILQEHYFPQPPDFPISRAEPAYLKTVWLRVG